MTSTTRGYQICAGCRAGNLTGWLARWFGWRCWACGRRYR